MKKQERVGREVEEEVQLKMRAAERADDTGPELLHGAESNLQVSHTPRWKFST